MTADVLPTMPPFRLEWLANAQGQPCAVRFHGATIAPGPLAAWLTLPDLPALCRALPCWLDAQQAQGLDDATLALAQQAGLGWLPASQVTQSAQQLPTGLSAQQLVSGEWYQQPPAKPGAAQAASRMRAMQLVQLVSNDADTHEIEAVLRQDATMSYQLLRVVNSVALGGGRREISSFAQAILLLGRQQLRRWLHLMLFAARDDDPRSAMLGAHVTLRARSMELLAEACGLDRAAQDLAFMGGMFSMLGCLFGQPLEQVLQPLALPDSLRASLLNQTGAVGQHLRTIQAAEGAGDTDELSQHLSALALPAADFNRLRLQAAVWTLQMTQAPAA